MTIFLYLVQLSVRIKSILLPLYEYFCRLLDVRRELQYRIRSIFRGIKVSN